jgi:hypothetical protein
MHKDQQFLLYTAPDGAVQVDVCFKDETVWLIQKALAELFGVKVPAVSKHLKNIFDSDFDREIERLTGMDQPPRRQERQGGNKCGSIRSPDMQARAIDLVLEQAEVLCVGWSNNGE